MGDEKGVEAVDRALALLDCFDDRDADLTLAELSRRTGFYKSTILRIAVSLERASYLLRRENGRFRLGPSLWRLGSAYRSNFALGEVIRPELRWLAGATRETASFYVREGDMRVCLYRAEPDRAIRHHLTEGAHLTLTDGASALVLRAWSPDAGPGLASLREAGVAVSRGARDPEVAAVAVPLLDREGRLRGALAVSGLITRFDEAACARFSAALGESAARLATSYDTVAV